MTTDQIIALAASIGACLSAVTSLFVVLQMKQQREASYQPELVITNTTFEASNGSPAVHLLATNWANVPKADNEPDHSSTHFSLPLCNIGLGAAKNISLSWSFPIEDMVNRANELAQRTLTPAYFKIDNGELSLKSDDLGAGTSMWKNQQHDHLDYVLPMSVQKVQSKIELPHAFIALSSALLFLLTKEQKHKWAAEPIGITATLSYSDIGNKQYTVVSHIKLLIVMISASGTSFTGILAPQKYP